MINIILRSLLSRSKSYSNHRPHFSMTADLYTLSSGVIRGGPLSHIPFSFYVNIAKSVFSLMSSSLVFRWYWTFRKNPIYGWLFIYSTKSCWWICHVVWFGWIDINKSKSKTFARSRIPIGFTCFINITSQLITSAI